MVQTLTHILSLMKMKLRWMKWSVGGGDGSLTKTLKTAFRSHGVENRVVLGEAKFNTPQFVNTENKRRVILFGYFTLRNRVSSAVLCHFLVRALGAIPHLGKIAGCKIWENSPLASFECTLFPPRLSLLIFLITLPFSGGFPTALLFFLAYQLKFSG